MKASGALCVMTSLVKSMPGSLASVLDMGEKNILVRVRFLSNAPFTRKNWLLELALKALLKPAVRTSNVLRASLLV